MLSLKIIYFLWLLFHITSLIISGWFGKLSIVKGATWSELIGYQSKFFPFQTLNIAHYDITEFLIYYAFLPYLIYKLFSINYTLKTR